MDSKRSTSRERDRSRRGERASRFDNVNDRDRSKEGRSSSARRIYISNIAYEVRWQDLKDLFRKEVGEVSFVELFNDENGKARGCGIIEFTSSDSVSKAIDKMSRYDLCGRNLVIKEDSGDDRDKYGYLVKSQGSSYRRDRDDDRSFNDSSRSNGGNHNSNLENFNLYGLSVKFLEGLGISQGPLHNKVFVANLDYKVDSKKLKQVFKLAGKVLSVDLSVDKEGNSRGFAVVEYDHPVEAVQAISMFDRQTLYDRRMTVRLDRIPDKNEGIKLPEGLKNVGIGLGPNGEPLRDVARNLPNVQNNTSQNSQNTMNNPLSTLSNSLNHLNTPTPVAPPQNSILGVPATNNLSGLAALTNLAGLGGVSALSNNPLLTTAAAASLNSILANDVASNQSVAQSMNQASFNAYNTSGFNANNRNDDLPAFGGNQVRNYNTSNDDYNSRSSFGGSSSSRNKQQQSDTILVRNLPSSWTWQNLRDKFRDIGEVKFAEIRGLDTGIVRFSKEREAEIAIKLLDGSRFDGRVVEINYF